MNSFELGSKHQHRGRSAQLGGSRFEHADHLLMTQMHAVVVAHGQNTASMACEML